MLQSSTMKAVESYRINAAKAMKNEMTDFSKGTRDDSQMEITSEDASAAALSHSNDPEAMVTMGELLEAINLIETKPDRKGRGRKRKTKGCAYRESSASGETGGPINEGTRRARSEEPRTNDKTEVIFIHSK